MASYSSSLSEKEVLERKALRNTMNNGPVLPALPEGWLTQWDEKYEEYFYFNTITGETQWEYPLTAADRIQPPDYAPSVPGIVPSRSSQLPVQPQQQRLSSSLSSLGSALMNQLSNRVSYNDSYYRGAPAQNGVGYNGLGSGSCTRCRLVSCRCSRSRSQERRDRKWERDERKEDRKERRYERQEDRKDRRDMRRSNKIGPISLLKGAVVEVFDKR